MNKFTASSWLSSCLLVLVLSGCGGGNTATGNQNPSTVPQNVVNATREMNPANNHRITVEQKVANRVAQVAHVRAASVLVTGGTAYVAVEMRPGADTHLTQKTKDNIMSTVKTNHPEIHTVLVTANPDAYQQFQTYAGEVSQGKPVTGIWNRFNAMVQRLWPNAK